MYLVPYALMLVTLLVALAGAGAALMQLGLRRHADLPWVEKAGLGVGGALTVASLFLLYALYVSDFRLEYVAGYTDISLPMFYKITAFWAGQAGSLLFWALMVALCGVAFQFSAAYRALSVETRLWYWLFFLSIMAFFGLLLSAWSNPFVQLAHPPADGRGLNPLLQNPGMVIHPPLLFLGYGGFVIPGCLALAQCMSARRDEERWLVVARPFTMTAWLFLTAGIVLGGWWAYMELGWGGYWAWDPVENASLLPWLLGTAALHTGILESRRGKLPRVNVFLMAFTTVSAFFATFLVRGNVVQSVHAFGEGGVGPALLIFVLAFTALAAFVACCGKREGAAGLEGLETREGTLVLVAWLLLALTAVILIGTLWPLISGLFREPLTLAPEFYNRVCLPLFAVLVGLLLLCPWQGWKGGIRDWKRYIITMLLAGVAMGFVWAKGYREPLALITTGVAVGAFTSSVLMLSQKSVRSFMPSLAAWGVHAGLAIMALGIAFSGPYTDQKEVTIGKGESVQVGSSTITLIELYEGRAATFNFLEAELAVSKGGGEPQKLAAQRRIYNKFPNQAFAEAATLPSLGDEIYATLLALSPDAEGNQRAVLHLSSHPLVNWLWIGGLLMCLFPLLALERRARKEEA